MMAKVAVNFVKTLKLSKMTKMMRISVIIQLILIVSGIVDIIIGKYFIGTFFLVVNGAGLYLNYYTYRKYMK